MAPQSKVRRKPAPHVPAELVARRRTDTAAAARPATPAPVQAPAPVRMERAAKTNGSAPAKPARAAREHVDPDEVKAWLIGTGKPMNHVARLCGLPGGPGPIQAAKRGRPLSPARFDLWRSTYAAASAADEQPISHEERERVNKVGRELTVALSS